MAPPTKRPSKLLLLAFSVPILAVLALFFIPIEHWNPGRPGLASGKVDVRIDESWRDGAPSLQPPGAASMPAKCVYTWREGPRLTVDLVAGAPDAQTKASIVLWHGVLGGARAGVILVSPGGREPERKALTGEVTLSTSSWSDASLPSGSFQVQVDGPGGGAWRGTFRPE
jgi:hypothetical protein